MRLKVVISLAFLCLGSICNAESFTGKVVGITDGDTITVLDNENSIQKVRLAGIDAPEHDQAFGRRSKQSLGDLIFGKVVAVETKKLDRYKRHVGKILLDGQDINLEQVRRGMAWFYRQYERELTGTDRQIYDQAETEARDTRKGLWSDRNPVPPWVFRHHKPE